MEFDYDRNMSSDLGIFVIAVSRDNRVANIGHIALVFGENVRDCKEYLKGIYEQNGYLVYSTSDQPFL